MHSGRDCHIGEGPDTACRDKAEPTQQKLIRLNQAPVAIGEEIVEPEIEAHRAKCREPLRQSKACPAQP